MKNKDNIKQIYNKMFEQIKQLREKKQRKKKEFLNTFESLINKERGNNA